MAGRISVFGLLSVATLISANPVPYPIAVPYLSKREDNATLQGHRPKDFSGCSSAQTSFINQAYADALTLASNLYPFLPPHDELSANNASTTGGVSGVGVLEQRFLAATSSWQHDSDANDPAQLVRNIVYNIAPGYFDYFRYQIQVSCVDIPNKRNTRCASDAGEGKPIGAYALSENGGPQIVVCSPFFETPVGDGSLAGVKAVVSQSFLDLEMHLLTKSEKVDQDPNKQKDPAWWKTAGHIYFHEMTHLSTIEDKPAGTGERSSPSGRMQY